MFTAFSTALSALRANSTAINIVGNNLANLNTSGFKSSDAVFSDLMSQTLGVGSAFGQVGMGVGVVNAVRTSAQGAVQTTNGALDAAVQGNGFFVVKDSANQQLFTRAGNFLLNSNGDLTTVTGEVLQGWNITEGVLNPNGALSNIHIPLDSVVPARATTTMTMNLNLDSRTAVDGKFNAPIQVFDAQGGAHTLNAEFSKTDANTWHVKVTMPASDVSTDPDAEDPILIEQDLSFDGKGKLSDPAPDSDPLELTVPALLNGADLDPIHWSFYNANGDPTISQFSQASGVGSTDQDGAAPGQIVKVGINNGGTVMATYSNGDQIAMAQLALASIRNPETLTAVGNNNLQVSGSTAEPAIGTANSGDRGQIVGGALESSTTDIATEFTHLLTFERGYQAASRVITTSDQLAQETVNLIHG